MLSQNDRIGSVIKVVDFGSSEFSDGDSKQKRHNTITTTAYCPPEAFGEWEGARHPSFDMFSMGCIVYIMLTGRHPFDVNGSSADAAKKWKIKNEEPPLRDSHFTAHLSDSALDLIEGLLDKSPGRRTTAMQMLDHPWVKGITASKSKIQDSDKRLKGFKKFKSKLEVKVFRDWTSGATGDAAEEISLLERAYRSLDTDKKGYVTKKDFARSFGPGDEKPLEKGDGKDSPLLFLDKESSDGEDDQEARLSLSEFEDLISDHMTNKYYPQDHIIFEEGSSGDSIYFINSGKVEVSTKAGFKTTLLQGALFGEGALLHNGSGRNATIRCLTPAHLICISKEYFLKYMSGGGSDMNIIVGEQDRSRDRERALKVLRLQTNLTDRNFSRGDALFSFGEDGKSLFLIDDGNIEVKGETGKHIHTAGAGSVCGEQSLVSGKLRNTTAVCASDKCMAREMTARDFFTLYNSSPSMKRSFRDISFRRDFQKAFAKKIGSDFGTSLDYLRKAFDAADVDKDGEITPEEVKVLLKSIYPSLLDDDPLFYEAFQSLDIDENDVIVWEEFKKIFLKD